MTRKEEKDFKSYRAKLELTIILLKDISNFESKEEPGTKLTDNDIIQVLSTIIIKKTLK